MTLFNDDIDQTVIPDNAFETLVGEGKKYRDPELLAKSVLHKDQFIEQLKTEQARLRADLDTRIKYEEFLDKVTSLQSGDTSKGAPSPDDNTSDNKTLVPSVTSQDVERLLEQRDAKKRREDNYSMVQRKLAETLGPNYGSKLKQRATELDMSESDLVNVAEQNPKAFFQLIGVEDRVAEQRFTPPPRNQLNTEFKPSASYGQKTFAHYEELRKSKPNDYWQPRIQNEMMKALAEQGDAFYS